MRLVPVFTLETNNQTNNECLPKFVPTDNSSSSIKTAIIDSQKSNCLLQPSLVSLFRDDSLWRKRQFRYLFMAEIWSLWSWLTPNFLVTITSFWFSAEMLDFENTFSLCVEFFSCLESVFAGW